MDFTPIFAVQSNMDMSKFQFRGEGFSYVGQLVMFGFLFSVVIAIAVTTYLYFKRRKRFEEMRDVREETRIKVLLSEFGMGEVDRQNLETYTESTSPGRYIPLLESRRIFETTIKDFRTRFAGHPALKHVPKYRQRLGYGFGNLRNKFEDTRMLPTGMRLQCKVPRVSKDVTFLSVIVGMDEEHFLIRPPTSKGKPLVLKNVPSMTFKVTREEDAEYEFIATIAGQSDQGMRPIAVEHTQEIQKLMFRNAPRVDVDLETQFFIVKKEMAANRGHAMFKAKESQFAFNGRIKDLSIGGALLVTSASKLTPDLGDLAVFKIVQAQIHDEVVGEVVRLTPLEDKHLQIHLRFSGMKEINRLKMNRFLETLGSGSSNETTEKKPAPPKDTKLNQSP